MSRDENIRWSSNYLTLKDVIKEAIESLGGEGSIKQVSRYIKIKYGSRWKNIGAVMADLTFPGNKSSTYPENERFLERIGRGQYRLQLQAAIMNKIYLVWRRPIDDARVQRGFDEWVLLGIFNSMNLALESVKGKNAVNYHVHSWPLNKFNPSNSEISFIF